jgi:uncharacterized Zn-finger protein
LYQCSCKGCESSFTQKGHLVRHEKIHTNEKPYECNVCNKKFTRRSGLLYHTRNRVCEKNTK